MASTGSGNLVKVESHMNSSQYQQILDKNVQESVTKLKLRRGWIFQQDSDPKHCSKSTKEFMQKNKYSVLEWPSQSPDLNIIENVLKIPPARLQGLVCGYRRRLQFVIAAEGGSTKYEWNYFFGVPKCMHMPIILFNCT